MLYWYVDPKMGEAVIMGKGRSESGNIVPKELIRIFDEFCFINFSVKDLEVQAERYCVYTDEWTNSLLLNMTRPKTEDYPELLSRGSLLKHFPVTNTLDR
ncbi:hypothetical protein L1987_48556 [Smallanthus sonchifolius]|uniref:Uncharacterized protein n=1 Tax=Smallanthus sonchifolius TaxID=185202 RepID=A0ACB9FRZ9_9ASTR|nr:hypothetical protein L1987_48556 [Smallanthus sonchifolius]